MIVVVQGELLRCSVCGLPRKIRKPQASISLRAIPRSGSAEEPLSLDQDLQTFIDRVINRLIPVHADYTPKIKQELQATRAKYREGLKDVFTGKGDFNTWFEKTRTSLALHQVDMTRMLYESLEGLRSQEAQQMREQYQEALQNLINSYKPV